MTVIKNNHILLKDIPDSQLKYDIFKIREGIDKLYKKRYENMGEEIDVVFNSYGINSVVSSTGVPSMFDGSYEKIMDERYIEATELRDFIQEEISKRIS